MSAAPSVCRRRVLRPAKGADGNPVADGLLRDPESPALGEDEDYRTVYWDLMEWIKLRFDAERISSPFPERDVHLFEASMP